jgi:lambda family phage portal protein
MVEHPTLNRVYGWLYGASTQPEPVVAPAITPSLPVITPDMMSPTSAPVRQLWHDGEKYPGGFGFTELLTADYWTLRMRSTQLFKTNVYARGIIRRLVTNVINTGLHLEAVPDEGILGVDEQALADWAEATENRFQLWERTPSLCDHKAQKSFGALQAAAKQEAFISGDVLVVLQQDETTGLPRVRLISGNRVQSPFGATPPSIPAGHVIQHGVELDADGKRVAYWITTRKPGTFEQRSERLPAMGATGRRNAWLVYGSDKLLDDVRGEPILSIMLQSLREIDRYRDAVQRKAVINGMLAMFVTKTQEVMGSRPLTAGGAVVKGASVVAGSAGGGTPKRYQFSEMIPGAVLDELAPGEEPKGFMPQGTDEKFADFEAAIVYAMAWALEVPPEILTLSFKNNYSASQAAVNEFKLFLNPVRAAWGDEFCQPIYQDWLLSEVLAGRIKADGLLEAWRDPAQYDRLAAWVAADWCGAIKPSIDLVKTATGYTALVEQGFISRDRATRETTGTKYSKNIAKLKRENQMLADAMKPLEALEQKAPKSDLSLVPNEPKEDEEDDNALAS